MARCVIRLLNSDSPGKPTGGRRRDILRRTVCGLYPEILPPYIVVLKTAKI